MRTLFTTRGPLDLSFTIKVNGVLRRVKFVSSAIYGTKCESLFSADAELAEAMKKHPMYGVYFYVKEDSNVASEVEETSKPEKGVKADNATIVDTVTTKAMAIAYIQGVFGESFESSTVEDMKNEALRKWNVNFVNWGK